MGLSEADTVAKLITPNLYKQGWTEDHIRREESAGAIIIVNGKPKREKKKVDITLRLKVGAEVQALAVALIEAKAEDLPPGHGLEQGKMYAHTKRLNVPFVYSSNGHQFIEYDRFSGLTSKPRPMGKFPTHDEIWQRYEQGMGFSLSDDAARPLLMLYPGGEGTRRYYQDAAIRAALEKIARGDNRILLSLATGSGKTRIAVWLLKRIADAGQLSRALFLCDRTELREQASGAFQNVFGNDAAPVSGRNPQKNARILIATYQTLGVDTEEGDASFLTKNYPENYFSHIIIDEAHRSAWGKWSEVLRRNPDAIQIGLTATPRQLTITADSEEAAEDLQISADNFAHFGEPVYEYEYGQGIEDGYLAIAEIQRGRVNLDDTGVTIEDILANNPTDAITGQPVSEDQIRQLYEERSFENKLLLPDRVLAMCRDLFHYLLEKGDPHQKTIIYCVRDSHADAVAATMNNLYAQWCADNGVTRAEPYAFKCTAASSGGDYVADLRGSSRSYFIATTVDLLSTGVDVPWVRNIVFFRYLNSPIAFYQMLGRGTRLHVPSNKMMFHIYDYTDATRLFGEDFIADLQGERREDDSPPTDLEPETIISVEGLDVYVTDGGRYVMATVDGKAVPMTVEEYREHVAERLVDSVPTLEGFRTRWIVPDQRRAMLGELPNSGRSALVLQVLAAMEAYDLYDVLGEVGYGLNPRTRSERADAFSYKHQDWLADLPHDTAETIRAIAGQFAQTGTDGLESPEIFQTAAVRQAGGLAALKQVGQPAEVLHDTKARMFAA